MNIFLDMDGVVADFVSGAIEAADLPLKHDDIKTWDFFKPYMTATEFWKRIHDTYEFWEGLEPYPWAQDLVDLCKQYGDVIFLSDSSHDDNAPSGKVKWLRRHGFLAPDSSNYMLGRQKHLLGYGDANWVLIDDSKDNCKSWESISILFPQRWNTWQFDKVDRLSKVRKELGRL
jgi:5'(3')-deoxyribonucleotidase